MTEPSRILAADDDATFCSITSRVLVKEGFIVDCVNSGDDAELRLQETSYDLLISDIEMPGNNDLQLVKHVFEIYPGLPIILATAYPSVDSAIESMHLPVFSYLLKPLDYSELLLHIYRAVARRRIVRVMRESELRVSDLMGNLAELGGMVQSFNSGSLDISLRTFVSLAFGNMISAMSELKTLLEIAYLGENAATPCRIINCPLKQRFENIMETAIESLKDTKDTFKSKEIADLRKKFERLLAEEREQSKPNQSHSGM
jgi:DNA-binding response OmpR family regulator